MLIFEITIFLMIIRHLNLQSIVLCWPINLNGTNEIKTIKSSRNTNTINVLTCVFYEAFVPEQRDELQLV